MTRGIKLLGATGVAVFLVSAMAAASASAANPQFVLPAGQSFPVGFTATSGATTFVTVGGSVINASSGTGMGKLINSKDGEVTLTFHGYNWFGFSCATAGQAAGTVKTNPLKSKLIYNVGKTKALDLLYPATEAFPPQAGSEGGVVAEFTCGFMGTVWRGAVLGEVPTRNVFLHSTSLVLKQTGGIQEFSEYVTEGGETRHAFLEQNTGSGFERLGVTTTDTVTFEGTREAKIEG